jgi:ribosomal protein S20
LPFLTHSRASAFRVSRGACNSFLQEIFHGKHRTSTQARTPSRRSERAQLGTALASAHRHQGRSQGHRRWRQAAAEVFKKAQSTIDSIADKKMVHKNKAARAKSRLSAAIKAMAA